MGSLSMCGGFPDISAPGFLALCQKVTGQIIKLKRETHKAEDLIYLITLKLQFENLWKMHIGFVILSSEGDEGKPECKLFFEQCCIKFSHER